MFTYYSRRIARPPVRAANRIATICVVDPQTDDYEGWDELAQAKGLHLEFLANAEEALSLSRTHRICLWVVNLNLPGLSGDELCSMLKSRDDRATVCLVAENYTPEAEQTAWRARATMFGVKPFQTTWLHHWLQQANLMDLYPLHVS